MIIKFCRMHAAFSNCRNLAQEYDNNYVLQCRYPEYTPEYIDWIYSLDYSRKLNPGSLLEKINAVEEYNTKKKMKRIILKCLEHK